jgi:uncharacterized protein YbaR (Trm112 family)
MEFIENLRCPLTKNKLVLINHEEFEKYSIPLGFETFGELNSGLIDTSEQFFYPIFKDIIILYEQYAIYIGECIRQQACLIFR